MRRMRMVVPVLAAGAWIFAAERVLAQPASDPAAVKAAESWLTLVDSDKYGESWKAAASLFREKVTAAQWEEVVRSARGPLGPVESRKRVSAQYTRTLPGAPGRRVRSDPQRDGLPEEEVERRNGHANEGQRRSLESLGVLHSVNRRARGVIPTPEKEARHVRDSTGNLGHRRAHGPGGPLHPGDVRQDVPQGGAQ